ncbi:MAG: hypothetical protein FDW93_01185 [Bergeyella sp.]|nr:hypothetical protein [Bergeyella sp.]
MEDNDLVRVSIRIDSAVFLVNVETIGRIRCFFPYRWGGINSANRLTINALDPISKISEF